MSTPTPNRDRALPRKRGRGVPLVFGVVSLVLVAVALTFALSSPPPSTPPLAEVAPAPQERIEVERVEQSSQFGEGAGGEGDCVPGEGRCEGAGGEAAPPRPGSTPSPLETYDAGKLRACVNGPGGPRQTDDPQSPPCKREIFAGDNGGATSPGVTDQTIRIAVPTRAGYSQTKIQTVLPPLAKHINTYYELYGRRLELVEVQMPDGSDDDPAYQRAFARDVASRDVFASLELSGAPGVYQSTLAGEGVVSLVGDFAGRVSEALAQELHPYLWQVYPSIEASQQASGRFVCDRLVGDNARHGGTDVRTLPRHFGILQDPGEANALAARTLASRLAGCGVAADRYVNGEDGELELALARMRDEGVTTVLCACLEIRSKHQNTAEDLGYRPEWFIPAIGHQDMRLRSGYGRTTDRYPRSQIKHTFGLSSHPRQPLQDLSAESVHYEEQFWFHAAKESDPDWEPGDGFQPDTHYSYYAQLLILASGIQWAGPDLTPETFADALTSLRYPNPFVGQPRWFQPAVGFGPGDHSFNRDHALIWWRDPDDTAYQSGTDFGRLCYVGGGTRFTGESMPADADERFFDPEAGCR